MSGFKRKATTDKAYSKCETGERRVDAVELEDFARLYRKGVRFFLPSFPRD